jgi:hypothetical protein
MMSGIEILALVLVIVLVVGAAALVARGGLGGPGGRSGLSGLGGLGGARNLRRRFGPEYDLLAQRRGDTKAVEQELTERVRAHDALTLRPLTPDERERYVRAWTGAQERFIDDPRGAARQAEQVVVALLTAIGYPSEDRDRQLALASVDHAYALSDYRQACDLVKSSTPAEGADDSTADPTETLRLALLHYRVMFKAVLDGTAAPAVGRAHAVR